MNVEHDQHATGHANSQTGDVDEGIDFMACDVADGDCQVVFEHRPLDPLKGEEKRVMG